MTQILRKRAIKTTPPRQAHEHGHAHGHDGRVPRAHADAQHAADLAQTLRALATRAHQAVKEKARDAADCDHASNGQSHTQTLVDLQAEIHRLQAELESQGLHRLVAYVTALRQEIEAVL
jgi:hypothetical protein